MMNISYVPQTKVALRALVISTNFLTSPLETEVHQIQRLCFQNVNKIWPEQHQGQTMRDVVICCPNVISGMKTCFLAMIETEITQLSAPFGID